MMRTISPQASLRESTLPEADDTAILNAGDYAAMRGLLESAHNSMHGFVNMGGTHISFRDPFVFLLHSNVDRLFARWQTDPAHPERLDPQLVYGTESGDAELNGNVEPWSTGHSVAFGQEHFTRPWFAPENQGVPHTYKDVSIVSPPRYDTNLSQRAWHLNDLTNATGAPAAAGDPAGYVFDAQGTQHVVYRANDGHICELRWG